jgi:UDP-N-acetylmuramate dehydrogenase
MDTRSFEDAFEQTLGKPLQRLVPLSSKSSLGIGGPADLFFTAECQDDLAAAVRTALRGGIRFYVMGGGTNILFDDSGYRGLIIKNAAGGIFPLPKGKGVEAVSGARLSDLVERSASLGLRGLECLAGIPGTVGGAVSGNAGAFGRNIGQQLASALVLDREGRGVSLSPEDLGFAYRRSALRRERFTLLRATFALEAGDEADIREDISCYLEQRKSRHPDWTAASAGCYFKNPLRPDGTRLAAGRLLEDVGASGLSRGGAAVSETHCNFIVNRGGARAADVLELARELKARVRERFGLDLEEEVVHLPAAG